VGRTVVQVNPPWPYRSAYDTCSSLRATWHRGRSRRPMGTQY